MSVEFEENNIQPRSFNEPTPKFAGWLISKGIASDVSSANRIQVIAALVILAIALYIFIAA